MMPNKSVQARGFLIGLVLLLSSCSPYSTKFDNKAIVEYCTRSAACEMELIDDGGDYYYYYDYDLDDEAAYQQLTMELCVDSFHDEWEMADLFGCKSEVKAKTKCWAENAPLICDYDYEDQDDMEDYDEDWDEVWQETCWKEYSKANNCFDW